MERAKKTLLYVLEGFFTIPTVIVVSIVSVFKWLWEWITAIRIEEDCTISEYVLIQVSYYINVMPKSLIVFMGLLFWIDLILFYFIKTLA